MTDNRLSAGHSEECIRGAHWKEYPPFQKLLGYKPAKGKTCAFFTSLWFRLLLGYSCFGIPTSALQFPRKVPIPYNQTEPP